MIFVLLASIPDKSMNDMVNKALINIDKDIYINYQIKNLLKINRKAKILVITAYESKKIYDNIIKHPRVMCLCHKYSDYSNIGESLKFALDYLPDNTAIHILSLAMIVDPNIMKNIEIKESSIILNESIKFKSKIGCIFNQQNNIEFIFYDLPNKICEYLFISKKDSNLFKFILKTYVKNNMYLFEIINTAIMHNLNVGAIRIKNNIMHFNEVGQLPKIKNLFRRLKKC